MSFRSWSSGLDARGKAKVADASTDAPTGAPAHAAVPEVAQPSSPTDAAPATITPANVTVRDALDGLPRQA